MHHFFYNRVCLRLNLVIPETINDIQKTSFKLKSKTQTKPCCSEKYEKRETLQQRAPIARGNNLPIPMNDEDIILQQRKNANLDLQMTHRKITYIAPNRCCSTTNYNFFDKKNDEFFCCGGTLIDRERGQECCFGVAYSVFEYECEMDSGYLSRKI